MADSRWVDPLLARRQPASANDVDALYRLHRSRPTRLAAAITLNHSLAEEVVQDAFAGLHCHRAGVDNPEAYLQRSVVNLGIKLLRRRAVAGRHPLPVADNPEVDETWAVSSSGVLFRALVGVPSAGSPIDAMRELVDFVVQPGTEVAATEP